VNQLIKLPLEEGAEEECMWLDWRRWCCKFGLVWAGFGILALLEWAALPRGAVLQQAAASSIQ